MKKILIRDRKDNVRVKLYWANCLKALRQIPDNSIHSCVTDPPYGLSFMAAKWDYDVPSKEVWKEVLRVLKPGGHLLAFGGTRTYHRLVVQIEDAGFTIRDMISWVYSSGFPKSLNVAKAITAKELTGGSSPRNLRKIRQGVNYKPTGQIDYKKGRHFSSEIEHDRTETKLTKNAQIWNGWGSALKPAVEPIVVARKPLDGKVAHNVLKYGTGAINIDGCRIAIPTSDKANYDFNNNGITRLKRKEGEKLGLHKGGWKIDKTPRENNKGRWPANFIHDGSEEVLKLFPHTGSGIGAVKRATSKGHKSFSIGTESRIAGTKMIDYGGDFGSAARFFYCAKASQNEKNADTQGLEKKQTHDRKPEGKSNYLPSGQRPRANFHPTVKPVRLMRYLCRLVTPVNGIVLDPYMGSGSTGRAAVIEGFRFVGIELKRSYCKIAYNRIRFKFKQLDQNTLHDLLRKK